MFKNIGEGSCLYHEILTFCIPVCNDIRLWLTAEPEPIEHVIEQISKVSLEGNSFRMDVGKMGQSLILPEEIPKGVGGVETKPRFEGTGEMENDRGGDGFPNLLS